ncbi:UNVERIFIED_CONTAM: hypothetical protein FKN15_077444 [Acipenser sinensis]
MNLVTEQYKDVVTQHVLGMTYENQTINYLKLLENYKTDEKISRFFQNMDFYVVPLLNMDGYNYTWTEVSLDMLNRDLQELNKTCTYNEKIGGRITDKYFENQAAYPNSGSSRDWARDIGIEFSYTFELRDNGTFGFELPEDQIQPTCEEAMAGVTTIVEYVHNKHFSSAAAATIYEWMDKVKNQYQDVVSQHFLGTTYEKRPIYFFKIGEKSDKPKKVIWMDCGIHAREWISPAFCQWFVKEILQNYKTDAKIKRFLQNMDFYVVPVLNIDGYIYTWTTDRLWRKSRSPSPFSNCTSVGTDLNRNFDSAWCCIGGSRNCSSQTFCGSAPGSESESKAVMELVNNKKNDILCFLTIHSYGQLIMTPFGEPGKTASNHDELMEVGQLASRAVEQKHGISYTVGPPSVVLYNYTGSSHDWARDIGIEFSYTFELRDNGTYGFELPEDQIQPTCEEAMAGVTTIVEYVHNKHFGSAAAATVALWSTVLASYLSLLVLVQ